MKRKTGPRLPLSTSLNADIWYNSAAAKTTGKWTILSNTLWGNETKYDHSTCVAKDYNARYSQESVMACCWLIWFDSIVVVTVRGNGVFNAEVMDI